MSAQKPANEPTHASGSLASLGVIPGRPRTPPLHHGKAKLLEDDGGVSSAFDDVLATIFSKYCHPKPSPFISNPKHKVPHGAVLNDAALDKFAIDTNGEKFSDATKEELKTFMDCDDQGNLTYNGFVQMYTLQSESDEDETWSDLSKHGYDEHLQLRSTRLQDVEATKAEGHPVPEDHISGIDNFRKDGESVADQEHNRNL